MPSDRDKLAPVVQDLAVGECVESRVPGAYGARFCPRRFQARAGHGASKATCIPCAWRSGQLQDDAKHAERPLQKPPPQPCGRHPSRLCFEQSRSSNRPDGKLHVPEWL